MEKITHICLKDSCAFRAQTDKNIAFCMFPKCPFNKSITVKKAVAQAINDNSSVSEVIARGKDLGLMP